MLSNLDFRLCKLALGLHSPVLALASQNRSAGNYGNGKGSAALDSLKESGDLEYAADVVLFLTEAQERLCDPAGAGGGADRGEKPAGRYRQAVADLSARSGHDAGGGETMSHFR